MENRFYKIAMYAATLLMIVTLAAHVFAGGQELYTPLRASDYPQLPKSVFSVIWHFVTLQLLLLAGALFQLTRSWNRAVFQIVLMTVLGFAALFLAYGISDFGDVWTMPQWMAFLGVGALMGVSIARA